MFLDIFPEFFWPWALVAIQPKSCHLDFQQSGGLIGIFGAKSRRLEQLHPQPSQRPHAQSEKDEEIGKAARLIQV